MHTFSRTSFMFALAALTVLSAGCDSSSDEPADSFDQMATMMDDTFTIFGEVAGVIFTGQLAAPKTQPAYSCQQSGSVDYTAVADMPGTYSLNFLDCNGIDGNATLGITTTLGETSASLGVVISGNLSNECEVNLSSFAQNVVVDLTSESIEIVLDGTLTSTCDGNSFSCTFANDTLVEGSEDALMREKCVAAL